MGISTYQPWDKRFMVFSLVMWLGIIASIICAVLLPPLECTKDEDCGYSGDGSVCEVAYHRCDCKVNTKIYRCSPAYNWEHWTNWAAVTAIVLFILYMIAFCYHYPLRSFPKEHNV